MLDGGDDFSVDGGWCSVATDVVASSRLSGVVRMLDEGKDVTVVVVVSLTEETIVSVEDRVVREAVVVHAITTVSIRIVIEWSIAGFIMMTDDGTAVATVVSALLGCSFEGSASATAEVVMAVVSFGCVLGHSKIINIKFYSYT